MGIGIEEGDGVGREVGRWLQGGFWNQCVT